MYRVILCENTCTNNEFYRLPKIDHDQIGSIYIHIIMFTQFITYDLIKTVIKIEQCQSL